MYVGCVGDKGTDRVLNNVFRNDDMTIEVGAPPPVFSSNLFGHSRRHYPHQS